MTFLRIVFPTFRRVVVLALFTSLLCAMGSSCIAPPPPPAEKPIPDGTEIKFLEGGNETPTTEVSPDSDGGTTPEVHSEQGGHDHPGENCVEEECATPPSPICMDDKTLREFNGKGSCHPTEDKCVFQFTDKTCSGACRSGKCLEKTDPCASQKCDAPPAATCLDPSTERTFSKPGTCKDGKCSYQVSDRKCDHGCKSGKCLPDPCAGKTCTKPPASKCVNSTTLRNYYAPGNCANGTCAYPHSDQKCPRGCANGKCKVGAGFSPLNPFRFLDTRGSSMPASDSTRCVPIAGKGGVSKTARAVYINLVAVAPTGAGFITAYPKGGSLPNASTLNYASGQTTANGSIIKLGTGGEICVFVKTSAHVIIDVYGFFDTDADYYPVGPHRRVDTRKTVQPGNDNTSCYKIVGQNGIPTSAKAVFVNLVAVAPTGAGHMIAYAKGTTAPKSSNLNYAAGETTSNGALVKLGSGGEICVFIKTSTHLIIDVYGYFGSSSSLTPITPVRRIDTRSGAKIGAGATKCYQVTGVNGIPSGARALAINLAAIQPSAVGHLVVFPQGIPRPSTSLLNHGVGGARSNNALVQPGTKGNICVYSLAATHIVLDIVGYWQGSAADPCNGVTCSNPPPTTCVGGKDLVSYAKTGSCKNGVCIYKPTTKTCSYKCSGAKCVAAPPPPKPTFKFHPVTEWQLPSQPVSSGSKMDISALRYITIHYNGGNLDLDGRDNVYQDSDFIQILRNTQNGYLVSRGYSLGYNSAIAPNGDEWEIRGLRYRCAANGCTAVNRPGYAIIIMLPSVTATPTSAQIQGALAAIARVRAAVRAAGNSQNLYINGHRDIRPLCGGGGTACPGDKLYNLIKTGVLK